jgi:HEAT repeat protein
VSLGDTGDEITLESGSSMFVLCPKCWREVQTAPRACPNCGTPVDVYSREYERRLVAALARSKADRRAKICRVLGYRSQESTVPELLEMLHDPDILVQVGALRALGELGDQSVVPAVEKAASGGNLFVRTVAKQVLDVLRCRPGGPGPALRASLGMQR